MVLSVGAQSRVGEFQIALTLMAFVSCLTLEDIVIDWLGKAQHTDLTEMSHNV